jgi:hypothetical protein
MFETELNYFIEHQSELVKKHKGKVLAIKGEQVVGVFDTPLDAYLKIEENHELGKIMIQPCENGVGAYTATVSTLGILE